MWSDLAAWFASPAGQRALTDAVLPVVAILVAAALAALIARSGIRRLERRLGRDALAAAVAGFAEAARRSAAGEPDPGSAARLASEADVRLRLSGRPGAELAAEWALLVSLAARGDDAAVVRDRLLEWVRKPGRAKRLFANDLDALHQTEAVPQRTVEAAPPRTVEAVPPSPAAPAPPRTVEVVPPSPAAPAPTRSVARAAAVPASPPPPSRSEAIPAPAPAHAAAAEHEMALQPVAVAAADHANQVERTARSEAPEAQPAPAAQPVQVLQPVQPPALAAEGAEAKPAWLDDYDDDAHVTRNIPLSTPAPVSASAIRDRGRPDDIVPS
jgi:hypothetical protein